MRETYEFHREVLKLLQWHCKPNLWHLRTPVHMFALDAFVEVYPNAKFLWSHRDPAKVLGSVCSLIAYVRSWSSDYKDPQELGAEQLAWWAKGIGRAMEFRKKFGDDRFVDVSFADLQTDPVNTVAEAMNSWASSSTTTARARCRNGRRPQAGAPWHTHLRTGRLRADPEQVREAFGDYLATLRRLGLIGTNAGWGGRPKLDPDPQVRAAILAAALESRAGGRCPRAGDRAGAWPRATGHPGVLPAFRLEGPVGRGGVPGDGARRECTPRKRRWQAPIPFVLSRHGSTGDWTWPSTPRFDPTCARCRLRRSRRCSQRRS